MRINIEQQSISVSEIHGYRLSIAQADNMGDWWWISRINVLPEFRGKGLGTKLLQELITQVHIKTPGLPIRVAPGGYDQPIEKQMSFYKKNGFINTKEEGLLELPC